MATSNPRPVPETAKENPEPYTGIPPVESTVPETRWERALRLVITTIGVVVILAMVFHVVGNALARTLFSSPLPASIEMTRYWFIPLIAAMGFIGAQMTGQHVEADLFYGKFTGRQRKWLTIATQGLVIAVLGVGVYYSMDEATHAMSKGIRAGFTDIPAWPSYFLVPLAFAAMILICAIQGYRAIRRSPESFNDAPLALGETI